MIIKVFIFWIFNLTLNNGGMNVRFCTCRIVCVKGINLIIGGPGAYRNWMGHTLGFRLNISFIEIVYGYKYIYLFEGPKWDQD